MIKRILAVLICVVMICSILPQITLFSSAAEDAEIDFTEAAAWEEYWDQYWKDHPEEWNNLESETASQRPATRSTSSDLSSMRARAEAIVNYQWTPSKNITTWNSNSYNGKTYFPTGSTVKGVPYTLFTSEVVSRSLCSLEQYKAVASSNYSASAYCVSTGSNRTGPVYGSCCADLVSEVFGGNFMNGSSPRYHSVGSIWNSSYGTTIHSQKMSDIRAGDALSDYPNHYHIVWVGEVTDSTITIYEQTPPVARKLTLNKASYTNSSGYFVYGGKTYSTITRSNELESGVPTVAVAPGKPALTGVSDYYSRDTDVTFNWAATENTTHYNIWFSKLDNSGTWKYYDHVNYASSGIKKRFEPGIYAAYVISYNSDAWEDDHSDWKHTLGDNVVFVYDYAKGKCGQDAYWRLQNGVLTIWGTGSTYDYDDYTTRPWHVVKDLITKVVVADGISYLGAHSFVYCENLTDVELASSLKSLGTWAFDHCGSLESISLPDSVSSLSYSSFLNCKSLKYANIPNSLNYIGEYMFSGCSSLNYIVIPSNIKTIKNYAFRDCPELSHVFYEGTEADWKNITIGEGNSLLTSCEMHYSALQGKCGNSANWRLDGDTLILSGSGPIYDYDNYNDRPWHIFKNSIKRVIVEEGITYLGVHCFYAFENLKEVQLPSTLNGLGSWAFDWCINLETIVLPDSISTVDWSTFLNCKALKEVNIPASLTSIGYHMFDGCVSLQTIIIPKSVTQIEDSAFYRCTALADVYYEGTQMEWKSISIAVDNDPLTYAERHYTALTGTCGDNAYYSFDGNTLTISGTGYIDDYPGNADAPWYNIRDQIRNAVVEEGITGLGIGTFYRCDNLVDVQLPSTLEWMGTWAFNHCISLKSTTLPDGIKDESYSVFLNCHSLEDVNIPGCLAAVGEHMFNGCSAMTHISIPVTVEEIKDNAFLNCISLANVYYEGTYEQWQKIKIGANNDCLTDANIHFNGAIGLEKIVFDPQGGVFASTYKSMDIDNTFGSRGAFEMTVFTGDGKTVDTNIYGYEVAVDRDGLVTDKRMYGDNQKHLTIPQGGFVLSANGGSSCEKAGFVYSINVGDYVAYDIATMKAYHYTDYDEYLSQQKRVAVNGSYGNLPVPTMEGHYFNGWIDENGNVVDYSKPFTSATLTARWADDNTLPEAEVIYNGHRYTRYEYNITWYSANAFCNAHGGHLVSITSEAEQNAVESLLNGGRNIIYFTGCNDISEEGNWVWTTGEAFSSYNKWDPQLPEPDESESEYDFGGIVNKAIGANKQFGEWLSNYNYPDNLSYGYRLCNYGFICEYDTICEHSYVDDVTAATCTEKGYTTHTCEHCGDSYIDTYTDALGHDYVSHSEKAATCTEVGWGEYQTCSRCDYTTYKEISATNHPNKQNVAEQPATCTQAGYTAGVWCPDCSTWLSGHTVIKEVDHSYSYKATTAPAIAASGILTGTCSRCSATTTVTLPKLNATDYTYSVTMVATCTATGTGRYTWKTTTYGSFYFDVTLAKTAHSYKTTVTASTCTAQGYTTHTCSACGDSYKDTYTAALGHSYTYKVTTTPTTSATGVLTGTCSRCSATTTVTLPKLNTTDYTYAVIKAATCTATGTGRYTWKMTNYGSFYFDVTLAKTAHSYKTTVTAPTCTAQGYTTHTCSACGDSYKDTYTAALGHSYTYKVTTTPTTSASGVLTGTCSRCSATTTVTLPKLNTTDYSYSVTKAATCTATGTGRYTWKTTTYGSFYFDVTIAKAAHTYTATVTTPTCTEKGYTTHTCSVCGDSYKDTYTDALGHNWDSGVITTQPTEAKEGVKTFTCTRCGETRTESVPVLAHTHSYTAVVTKPTCTEKGYTTYTCSCGDSYVTDYVAALGHSWDDGVVTTKPTETSEGIKTFTCSRCGATRTESVPALDHTHSYTATVTPPTCTEKGYTTYTCACGDSYVTDYVGALGHDFVDGVCTRCGEDDPNYNPPTPKDPCEGYTDINRSKWYHAAADFVIERGLMGSTKTNALTFEPNTPCTRSMIVMILYNIAGTPDVSYTAKFPDVPAGKWYTNAIMWAYQNGIVSGYDNGKFGPNDKITREQMAVILKGYADFKDIDTSKTADLSKFPDSNKATWSKTYISWAVAEGLISGKAQNGKTYLDPQGVATRAEVAALIRSFVLNILEAK